MHSGVPFGRYTLVRRLARGGMAEIFLALQEGPEGFSRRLVIKRILPHLAADASFLRMFMDEARIVAMLSHPHIVHLYDFGQEDGSYYLAMEYVDGIDLKSLTERAGPVPPEHAAKIMSYVCEGLAHAQELTVDGKRLGLVHRDVTPSNILISFEGSVKVADFGIAKAYTGDDQTRVGVVKGKYAYLSPEQARGLSLDHRSDQFNIGILLHELLTARPLFPQDSYTRAVRAILGGKVDSPEKLRADIPNALSRIVMRALSLNRDDRYSDTLALRADLERFLREFPNQSDAVMIGRYVRQLFPSVPDQAGHSAPTPRGTAPMLPATAAGSPAPSGAASTSTIAERAGTPEEDQETTTKGVLFDAPTEHSPELPLDDEPSALGQTTALANGPRVRQRTRWIPTAALAACVSAAAIATGVLLAWQPWQPGRSQGATRPRPEPTLPASDAHLDSDPGQIEIDSQSTKLSAAPVPPAAGAPSTCWLELTSEPIGSRVRVDGELKEGVTPMVLADIMPGEHIIHFERDGHDPLERRIVLEPQEHRDIYVELRRNRGAATIRSGAQARSPTGTLTISTFPYSRVYLGGRLLGETPLANVRLPAGRHVLRLVNPDRGEKRITVVIEPDRDNRVRLTL